MAAADGRMYRILRAPMHTAKTARVNFTAPGDDERTEVWKVNIDFSGAET